MEAQTCYLAINNPGRTNGDLDQVNEMEVEPTAFGDFICGGFCPKQLRGGVDWKEC